MGIQDKIASSLIAWKRSVHNYKILTNGDEKKVIRIKVETNDYDDEDWTILSNDLINVFLEIPDDIPLERLRRTADNLPQTTNTYLFDILPITGIARWDDNVEKGDLLIHRIYDENPNDQNPLLWILQVSQVMGSINVKYLTNKKFYCAPYNGIIPTEVQTIIESYKDLYRES
jgi:hypothetical protein